MIRTHIVDDEHPRLIVRLVSLGDVGDSVLSFRIPSDVDLSSLVVDGGDDFWKTRRKENRESASLVD